MIRLYGAIFATETPFRDMRYAPDADGDWGLRTFEGRLIVDPTHIVARSLTSPNGIQVLWAHGERGKTKPSVGRVTEMDIDTQKRIVEGALKLDDKLLANYTDADFESLEAGINAGLSIGFQPLTTFEWTLKQGTFENPDQLQYGRIKIVECSLTPLPRLEDCGLLSRLDTDTEGEDDDDESERSSDAV